MTRAPRPEGMWRAAVPRMAFATLLLGGAVVSRADTPPFDRPGIAFSTDTLAAGRLIVEQGAPDVVLSSRNDDAETTYTFDTRLRFGLTDSVEAQVMTSFANEMRAHRTRHSYSADGHGDTAFAIKARWPSANERFSWATLATVTIPNGSERFSNDDTTYDIGATFGSQLNGVADAALFVDVERSAGDTDVQLAPSVDFTLTSSLGAFVEAGATLASQTDAVVTGGGFMWLVTRSIQLDLSADVGLNHDSPRLLGGLGVSIFF